MRRIPYLLLAISLFAGPMAIAAVSDEDFEQMRQQLAAVSKRLDELARENEQLRRSQEQTTTADVDGQTRIADVKAPGADMDSQSWPERIRLDGDFRYRYEAIDLEGSPTRRRNRINARANVRADLADDVEVGFGLATGGDDPVSTNQTLGAGGSSKNTVLNLAYADWKATDNLHLIAGKFGNPLVRVGKQALMWDGDWTPEGFGLSYKRDWFFANAIATWLESDSIKDNDNFSWGGQFGATGDIGGTTLKGGVGYFSINTKGGSTPFGDPSDPNDYFGNSAVEAGGLPCGTTPGATCAYVYDYLLTQAFAKASFDLGKWPTVVFFDYVHNSDAPENNTGWTIGTRVGHTDERGQMQFSYYYADKPADSLLGLLTDSDFGNGGTDNKGHFLKLMIGVNKSWSIGGQFFINEVDVSSGSKKDFNRLMIDTQWKWE